MLTTICSDIRAISVSSSGLYGNLPQMLQTLNFNLLNSKLIHTRFFVIKEDRVQYCMVISQFENIYSGTCNYLKGRKFLTLV